MFSSNPFTHIPHPIHVSHPLNPFFDLENDGVYFYHHEDNNNPLVSGDSFFHSYNSFSALPSVPPPVTYYIASDSPKMDNQKQLLHEGSDLLESVVYPSKKKAVASKKVGHSKIYTAQGLRARRVRLSIDIARKFFVLQDLLGCDKASKTVDWLFTKSKKAIKELIEETKHASSSTVSSDECKMVFLETIKGGSERKKMTQKCKPSRGDQSRADARARARERTKLKLRIKELENGLKKVPDDYPCHALSPSNITLQSSSWDQFESQSDYNNRILQSSKALYTYNHDFVVPDEWISQISSNGMHKFTGIHEEQGDHAMI